MSERSPIYAASQTDASELRRALGICLAGMALPEALAFPGGSFALWATQQFLPVIAPHAMLSRELALRGEAGILAAADAALSLAPSSANAGRKLLTQREGARHLPVARRFAASVHAGVAAGHFSTVFALQAADFSIAVLPMLQGLLYCEWRTSRPADAPRELTDFLHLAAATLAALPALLNPHPSHDALPLAAVR